MLKTDILENALEHFPSTIRQNTFEQLPSTLGCCFWNDHFIFIGSCQGRCYQGNCDLNRNKCVCRAGWRGARCNQSMHFHVLVTSHHGAVDFQFYGLLSFLLYFFLIVINSICYFIWKISHSNIFESYLSVSLSNILVNKWFYTYNKRKTPNNMKYCFFFQNLLLLFFASIVRIKWWER